MPVVIIGAGQAGLALSYYLSRHAVEHQVLEAEDRVGSSWAPRWDSLRLFTPAEHSALPGMPPPGDAGTYPGKDDIAAYLGDYAATFSLPVRTSTPATGLQVTATGFQVATPGGTIPARSVVLATGAFGSPWVPPMSASLTVPQLHSHRYRRPNDLPGHVVAVIGAGNTGVQLAAELAAAGREVLLSHGRTGPYLPQRLLGRDIFAWLTRLGLMWASADSGIGRRMRAADPIIGTSIAMLERHGVQRRARAVETLGALIRFADGRRDHVDAVLWATGYRHDDAWLNTPAALDRRGTLHTRGFATTIPGLFVLGRPWQRNRGSALIGFVGADASILAQQLQNPARHSRSDEAASVQ